MTEYARGLAHEPTLKPERPFFSSGPTAKFPGWSLDKLKTESLGRSHRSALGKARLKYAIDLSRELLGIPDDYLIGIMPASDTGAIEAAMWAMLDPARPVTVAAWESFGNIWIQDAVKQLKLPNLTALLAGPNAMLKADGGIVMVTAVDYFVSEELRQWRALRAAEEQKKNATSELEIAKVEAEMSALAAQLAAIKKLRGK